MCVCVCVWWGKCQGWGVCGGVVWNVCGVPVVLGSMDLP